MFYAAVELEKNECEKILCNENKFSNNSQVYHILFFLNYVHCIFLILSNVIHINKFLGYTFKKRNVNALNLFNLAKIFIVEYWKIVFTMLWAVSNEWREESLDLFCKWHSWLQQTVNVSEAPWSFVGLPMYPTLQSS